MCKLGRVLLAVRPKPTARPSWINSQPLSMTLKRFIFISGSLCALLLCVGGLTEHVSLNLTTVRVAQTISTLSKTLGQSSIDQAREELVSLSQSLGDHSSSPGSISYRAAIIHSVAPLSIRTSMLEDLVNTPKNTRPLVKYWLGDAYFESSDYPRAISTWAEVGAALRLKELGHALGKAGRWQEAAAAYQASLESFGGEIKVYLDLGAVLVQLGRHDEAVQVYEQGMEIAPGNWGPYVYIGNIYRAQKDFERAQYWYNRGIKATSSEWPYIELARMAEAQGALDLAESTLRIAVRINPGNSEAWLRLGLLLRRQGICGEGIAALEKAAELTSSAPGSQYQALGDMKRDCGDPKGALRAYEAALRLSPDNDDLRRRIASIRQSLDGE